ncbi:hypothetical protein PMAYCL1PPCAC_17242, partial [Pristionchus mayeri]
FATLPHPSTLSHSSLIKEEQSPIPSRPETMILLILVTLFLLFLFQQMYWRTRPYPPGPTPIPVLGNLHTILREFPGQTALNRWRKQYGKIFTHWLGSIPIVSVADYQTIHEMFVLDGDNYADRGTLSKFTEEFRGGILGIIETSGSVWRDQRRFALHTLRDFGMAKEAMQERILYEAVALLDKLEEEANSKGTASPLKLIEQSVASVINLVIFGYRFDETTLHELQKNRQLQDDIIAIGKNPLNSIPLNFPTTAKIWPFKQIKERVMKIRDEQFSFFEKNIEKHRAKIDYSNDECEDFCDAYLKEMERRKDDPETSFHDKQFVNVCIDLWSAGMETTAMTMSWGMIYLLHHPLVQEKLHEEYDRVIGSDRLITMADKNALPYTAAYINELQRCANILPQNLLRQTTKDITIDGIQIPSGTAVCPQISVLMCDPEIFPDPESFNPSRFIDESGKVKTVKQLLPFSIGKRQCPGEGLARMELFLFFSNLVHRFKISPSDPLNLPSLERTFALVGKPPSFEVKLEGRFLKSS